MYLLYIFLTWFILMKQIALADNRHLYIVVLLWRNGYFGLHLLLGYRVLIVKFIFIRNHQGQALQGHIYMIARPDPLLLFDCGWISY